MKKATLFVSILLLYLGGNAQNPGWAMPDNYLKFQNGVATQAALPSPPYWYGNTAFPNTLANEGFDGYDAGTQAEFTSNMMLDRNGDILFFIVDGFIYDGEGNFIEELKGGSPVAPAPGSQETAIIPDPGNCDRYYIVTHSNVNNGRYPILFHLDMSLPNIHAVTHGSCEHYGALLEIGTTSSFGKELSTFTPNWFPWSLTPSELPLSGIAVSDLREDNSYFVFVSAFYKVYKYKVDATGFNPINSFLFLDNFSENQYSNRSEMELVQLENGNYRLALTYETTDLVIGGQFTHGVLLLVDFDNDGDLIPGSKIYFPTYKDNTQQHNQKAHFKGLEFSSNGERLYATRITTGIQGDQFSYFDYTNQAPGLQAIAIPANADVRLSQIELGPNDTLYIPHENGILKMPNATLGAPGPVLIHSTFSYPVSNLGYALQPNHSTRLYLLPDQIDGMDYEAHNLATQQCCINSGTYEADKYIAGSGLWKPNNIFNNNLNPFLPGMGSDVYIKDELRIPAGANVTIEHMVFHFAPGARVVIENGAGGLQGGKLTLNNTKFTVDNRCGDDLWMGVEVWGNTNELQGNINNSSQGRLVLQNNAEISHAYIGALAGKRKSTFTPVASCPAMETVSLFIFDPTHNGGIVQATNSSINNNQRGVFFRPYIASNNSNNLSFFERSNFVWEAPLLGGYSFQSQAHLYSVKGIRFTGVNFENQAQGSVPYSALGNGIYSYNSQFHVNEYCPVIAPLCTGCNNGTPSTFQHFRYGIRSVSANESPLTFSVKRSEFEDCQYGIYAILTNNSVITNNDFNIRQASYQTAGIAMYRTPEYTIQENTLVGIGNPAGQLSYGMVINNTDTINNDIYKNSFEKLHIGAQSEGVNAIEITPSNSPGVSGFEMSGLNYTCNNFNASIDLADMTVIDGRIDYHQGQAIGHPSMNAAIKGSSRNYFSLDGEGMAMEHDINISGSPIQPIQYVGLNSPNYFLDSYSQNWVLPLISSYNGVQAVADVDMCPSLCESSHEVLVVKRLDLIEDLNDLENELQGLDPGDHASLLVLQDKIHAVKEQIDLVEKQIVGLIILEEDDISVITAKLTAIGKIGLLNDINNLLAEDQTMTPPCPAPIEIDNFLRIVPAGGGRKVGAAFVQQEMAFSISPNPSNGNIAIAFKEKIDAPINLTVIDLMGNTVFQSQSSAQQSVALDLKDLNNGVYFVLVKSEGRLLGSKKIEILR